MFDSYYKLVICILLCVQGYCSSLENETRIIYDQKQSGKFNIHINIKDVAIIDVNSNEFIDDTVNDVDEYYYDEDDLTVKPLLPWPPSPSDTAINYSPNHTLSDKEQMHQLSVTGNETNTFNYTNLMEHTTAIIKATEDVLHHLVIKPVLNHHNEPKDNDIPLTSSAALQNTRLKENIVIPSLQRKRKSNSSIIEILSGHIFKKSTGCNVKYGHTNNRNCRKRDHSTWIKSLIGLLHSMKIKDN